MSDPVTNVEIEDVLSSIRRLVAEGGEHRTSDTPNKNTVFPESKQPDRFVLTPALRVTDTPKPAPVYVPQPQFDSVSGTANVSDVPGEPLVLTPASIAAEPLVSDTMSASDRASLEAKIAELEAAVGDQQEDWEPEGHDVKFFGSISEAFADLADDTPEIIDHDEIEEVFEDEDEDDTDATETLVNSMVEEVAAAAVSQSVPEFRHMPIDDTDTDYGDELRPSDDDGLPIPDDLDESIAEYLSAPQHKVDDATLRKMVADVVREELQGELGERITRNVRKLVRQEISNALSSRNLG